MEISNPITAEAVARGAFDRGLVIELCGAKRNVLKFLPPLIIESDVMEEGLDIIEQSIRSVQPI